jgi:hypothetical protein
MGERCEELIFTPDGKSIVARSSAGTLSRWDVTSSTRTLVIEPGLAFEQRAEYGPPGEPVLACSADGSLLLVLGQEAIRFYRLGDGQLVADLPVQADQVAVDPLGRRLLVLSAGAITMWGVPLQSGAAGLPVPIATIGIPPTAGPTATAISN